MFDTSCLSQSLQMHHSFSSPFLKTFGGWICHCQPHRQIDMNHTLICIVDHGLLALWSGHLVTVIWIGLTIVRSELLIYLHVLLLPTLDLEFDNRSSLWNQIDDTIPELWFQVASHIAETESKGYCLSSAMIEILDHKPWHWQVGLAFVIVRLVNEKEITKNK